ncbi:ER-Golgi vesicle-tethering protein p115 [Streptomyces azureus]|uniref:ER-Golgi vesicle-tethering protein p115 n=1 Tax=Streptomyces azureus TaxID=146537 RepID=A0A0K8PQ77_STRAJ|nr:ER-Golgi vesicle-tethering protein p115 [Streptomyces azureus]
MWGSSGGDSPVRDRGGLNRGFNLGKPNLSYFPGKPGPAVTVVTQIAVGTGEGWAGWRACGLRCYPSARNCSSLTPRRQ